MIGAAIRGAIALLFVSATVTGAWSQVAGGSYISLDGTMEHDFQQSGDYLGRVHGEEELSGAGVYREGPDTCWLNRDDGSKLPGDVLFYVGEVQCCLSVEAISDKFAFTQVWVKGTGFGYRMCKNQVFARTPE